MMVSISPSKVNQFVVRKHYLVDSTKMDNLVQIVKDLSGLHASIASVPYLSLFARTQAFSREKLDEELYVKRTMGKIRCMRKTVHIVSKDMIPIAFAATRRMIEPTSAQYAKYLGITLGQYEEISKQILESLTGRKMTTKEIKKTLGTRLNISPIVNLMCDRGVLIRGHPHGGWKSNLHTYQLFNECFPDLDLNMVDEETARRRLIERYLASYGPVTETDVAWWTGFRKGQIKRILNEFQDRVSSIDIADLQATHFILSSQRGNFLSTKLPKAPVINLLPRLDPYLMGYKDRDRYLDHKYCNFIFDRSGSATSTILLDGRSIGVWDIMEQKNRVIKIFLFEKVKDKVLREIHLKGRQIGQFITDDEVQIQECDSMVPLTRRRAGGFHSPLRSC